jgi:hypothetical protein
MRALFGPLAFWRVDLDQSKSTVSSQGISVFCLIHTDDLSWGSLWANHIESNCPVLLR